MISNGKSTSRAGIEANLTLVTSFGGFAIGSPGWMGAGDVQTRIDAWLGAYATSSAILLDNPQIAEDRKSTRLNSITSRSRMPSSA